MSEITKVRNISSTSQLIKTSQGEYVIPPNSSVNIMGTITEPLPKGIYSSLTMESIHKAVSRSASIQPTIQPVAPDAPLEPAVEEPAPEIKVEKVSTRKSAKEKV